MLEIIICILVILAIIGGLYLYGTWNHRYFKKRNFPSMPSPVPFFGNMSSLLIKKRSVCDLIQHLYDSAKGHRFYGFMDFSHPAIVASDPESIKLITVTDFEYFADRVPLVKEIDDALMGKSFIALEGQRWKDMRAILSRAFASSKVKDMFGLISESAKQLADHLEKRCEDEKNTELELDMTDLFTRYVTDVIATAAFGIRNDSLGEPDNEFYKTGKGAVSPSMKMALKFVGYRMCPAAMKFLGIPFMPKTTTTFFRSLVVETMKEREKEGIVRPDMIHLLMQAKKGTLKHEGADGADDEHGKKLAIELTDDDITAQAFTFFVVGFDSTYMHLGFLSHLLATHPDVQRRVQEEIDAILEADGGTLTYEGVQKAKYLDMCVSETMRLWPSVVVNHRTCVKPYVLPATDTTPRLTMKKGDVVWIPIIGFHRDPRFFPEPDKFDPERFSDENKHNIQPYTFMPFGTGRRNCVAMLFAQMEVKAAMMHLLSRFNLEVSPKTPKRLVMAKTMNVSVEGGFWLGIKPRS